jgi:ABC-type nitrate/sulfonate/bicarbonate transport system substrate-binding protein
MISKQSNLLLLFLYLFTFSILAQASNDKVLDKVSIQLKWYNQFQFAGYYVAKYKGYYTDVGLDVDIIEGGPNASYENILSGKINFGVADSRILLARMQKKPVVALAAIFQHTPDAIISRYDKKIRIPAHLINKKIMLAENMIPPAIQAIFLKEGIPLASFTPIPNDNAIDSISTGKIDALFGYITNEAYHLDLKGIRYNSFAPNDFGIDFYGDILYTSENETENNRERVKAFLKASLKGWQYAMDNVPETVDLILNTSEIVKVQGITKNYLLYEAKALETFVISSVIPIGHINPDRMQRTAKTFESLGLYKGEYSLEGFIFDPDPKVDPRWKKYLVVGSITLLPIIMLSTILIFILRKLVTIRTRELLQNKKRLEELNYELEKSERKYKDLIENSKDIIFSLNGEGRILTINRAVTEILKFKVKDLIGKNFAELLYNSETVSNLELYKEIFKYTIQEVIDTKGSLSFNSDLTNKIGEPLEIGITLQFVQMDQDFILLGTASLVKEDELLKFCEEERQVFKIKNYLTHVDAICHRLPLAALRYSNQDTVFNIRLFLREMLINAIEHGNLNISFDEKTELQATGDYLQFLIERQKEPKYTNKFVTIEFIVNPELISFRITDEGSGFDHKKMLQRKKDDKEIQSLSHGRGIIMTRNFFDIVEYNEKGNSIYLVKYFNKQLPTS